MIKKVAFLGHPTRDMATARKFFGETLGLKLSAEHADLWCEFTTPDGTTVALDGFSPLFDDEASIYMALETDDIAAEFERLSEAGLEVLKEPWTNKSGDDGPEICKMAILKSPDGHPFMLHEIAPDRA